MFPLFLALSLGVNGPLGKDVTYRNFSEGKDDVRK